MSVKINLKRIVSYLIIFAMTLSFMQIGQSKPISAATIGNGVNQVKGLKFHIGDVNGDDVVIDRKANNSDEYLISSLPYSKTYTLEPESGYTIENVTSDNDEYMNIGNKLMSDKRKMYFINSIKNYSNFVLTVTIKDSDGVSETYKINVEFEENSSIEFKEILVTLDNNDPISFSYDEQDSDGFFYLPDVKNDVSQAKFQVIDDSNKSLDFKLNGSSNKTLKLVGGDNTAELAITKNGFSKVYTVVITKKGEAKLKSLVPSTGKLSPSFDSETTDYEITVPTTTTSIAFTPTTVDNSSTIKVKNTTVSSGKKSQDIKLSEGENEIPITVKTKNGDTTIYNVVVTRTEQFRSADLKSLKLTKGTLSPTFNKGVYEYSVSVDNSVTSIGVTPVAEDSNATIEVNGKEVPSGATSPYISLDEGGNVIDVTVTDSKGNENTYILTVTRKYSKNNVNLESLTVTDGTFSPKFDPETYAYSVKVPRNVEDVKIKFESQNEKAKIVVNGVEYESGQQTDKIKLDLGANTVTVKVVAEDKKTTTNYILSIIRDKVQGTLSDWVLVGGEWMFYDGDGIPAKNKWVIYDNQWYHLDVNGYMDKDGWLFDGGQWYYLDPNGIMLHGWIKDTGYWYYLRENGPMVTNSWAMLDGNWYYFNEYGHMQTGWILYLGKWYFFDDHGVMQKGWITYDKNKYYLDDDGTMRNGWLYSGKVWYYLDESGKMVTGWQTIGNRTYYFDSKGAMKTGMLFLDGRWINLDSL